MAELRELTELREQAASFFVAEERAAFRDAAGLPPEEALPERLRAHPRAASREGLQQVCEALRDAEPAGAGPGEADGGERRKAGRSSRLANLRARLVRARACALEPGAWSELRAGELRPSVELHGDAGLHGKLPLRAVERELGRARARDERAEVEAAFAAASGRLDGARTAAWEAAASALGELHAGEPIEAAASLHEHGWTRRGEGASGGKSSDTRPEKSSETWAKKSSDTPAAPRAPRVGLPAARADAIAAACERLLARTDAIARDLGGWLLERQTGARPHPGDAERHDLLALIRAPRCASAFPRGEMLRSCRRWAEAWPLDLDADRAVKLDDDARPLAREGAGAWAIDPPDAARVQLLPEEGPWALGRLLAALGEAQLLAGPPGDAPPEDLLAHDPALRVASGEIFAGLLRDDLFRRRCAKAELPLDDARALAVAALFQARLAAARALASLEGLRGGLGARTAQLHRELFARAGLCALPAGLALAQLDPFLDAWAELRGLAFAARARLFLRERFDQDWWRNPRALAPLRSMWTRGGRPSLRELWQELAPGEEPSLEPLALELGEGCA